MDIFVVSYEDSNVMKKWLIYQVRQGFQSSFSYRLKC